MKIEDTNRDPQAGNLRLPELNWPIGTNTRYDGPRRCVGLCAPAHRPGHFKFALDEVEVRHRSRLFDLGMSSAIGTNTYRFYMKYSFLRKFLGAPFAPEMAVDLLQCFPANCL